jgi:hypothetical protein
MVLQVSFVLLPEAQNSAKGLLTSALLACAPATASAHAVAATTTALCLPLRIENLPQSLGFISGPELRSAHGQSGGDLSHRSLP